jgi:hypothetical protein
MPEVYVKRLRNQSVKSIESAHGSGRVSRLLLPDSLEGKKGLLDRPKSACNPSKEISWDAFIAAGFAVLTSAGYVVEVDRIVSQYKLSLIRPLRNKKPGSCPDMCFCIPRGSEALDWPGGLCCAR